MLKTSAFYLEEQKSFVPKKICGMLVIETLKSKISDFLNSNTCFCSRLYSMWDKARIVDKIKLSCVVSGQPCIENSRIPHSKIVKVKCFSNKL